MGYMCVCRLYVCVREGERETMLMTERERQGERESECESVYRYVCVRERESAQPCQ